LKRPHFSIFSRGHFEKNPISQFSGFLILKKVHFLNPKTRFFTFFQFFSAFGGSRYPMQAYTLGFQPRFFDGFLRFIFS